MIKGFVSFIVKHRFLTVTAVAGLTVFFAYQIWNPWMAGKCMISLFKDETACWWSWKIKMVVDPKTILPQDHPYVQLNDRIEQTFGGSRVVVIGVEAKSGDIFNPATLRAIESITEEVKNIPGIKEENVISITDRKVKHVESEGNTIRVERLMNGFPETPQAVQAFRERVFSNPLYVGSLVSKDGKAAAIVTDFREWVPAYEEEEQILVAEPYPEALEPGEGWEGAMDSWQEASSGTAGAGQTAFPQAGEEGSWWKGAQDAGGAASDRKESSATAEPKAAEAAWWKDAESSGETAKQEAVSGGADSANPWWPGEEEKGEAEAGASASTNPWWQGGQDEGEGDGSDWAGGGGFRMSDSAIYEAVQQAAGAIQASEANVYIGGLPVALAFMERDSARIVFLFPLALLIMMLILYWAFRSFQGMILPLVTALLSVIWALGLMGLAGIPMDPFNTLTPILILAVAAGHSIQILKRYYEELKVTGDNRTAVIEATSKIAPVTITAALVAAASFSSLITFELKTFQAFGLFTAFGILSALILEMTFIPAMRAIMPAPKAARREGSGGASLDRFLAAVARQATGEGRRATAAVVAILLIVAAVGAFQVRVDNSLKSQFFESTPLRIDERALNDHFAGTSTFYILVEGDRNNALKDPSLLKAIDGLQRSLETVPGVGKTESFVDYLKMMNKTFHGGAEDFNRVPDEPQQVKDFLFLYSISGNPADFTRLVDYDYRQAVIWSYLKSDSTVLAEELIRRVEDYARANGQLFRMESGPAAMPVSDQGAGFTLGVAGSSPVTVALNRTMVEGKIQNILQIAAIIFIASAFVFRSVIGGLMVLLPLSLAVLINFGVMGLTGITLGIGTAAISAMAVGIGADYAIYLLFRIREEFRVAGPQGGNEALATAVHRAVLTAGKAVVFVALSIAAGYAILPFSGYYLHMEGILVPLAMITSCLGALLMLSALVMVLKPRFIIRAH